MALNNGYSLRGQRNSIQTGQDNQEQDTCTSLGVSVYSFVRSTATMLVSSSLVIRTTQFSATVTYSNCAVHIVHGYFKMVRTLSLMT